MKRNTVNKASDLIMSSPASFVAALFFFVLGLSAGVFTELMMTSAEKEGMISYLDKYFFLSNPKDLAFTDIFMNSAGNNLGLLIIILLSGMAAIGFPIALAALVYKGMALGFSAALLIDSMNFKGVAIVFTSMIPQNLLIIPAMILACVAALNIAFHTISNRKFGIKKSLAESSGSYLFLNLLFAVAILGGCFIESFLSPLLTRLIV
ncbi:stage II sporulation protein M [Anoxybacterium hadale]|uniref:Stage II sporulation protein M n=1 Tax=Anoxybacterium hadale TaxID=3408580 RepID=A0ACD1AAN1_9FIRM|nr:stage II sporulation protein M [Clostridiales bacterium]